MFEETVQDAQPREEPVSEHSMFSSDDETRSQNASVENSLAETGKSERWLKLEERKIDIFGLDDDEEEPERKLSQNFKSGSSSQVAPWKSWIEKTDESELTKRFSKFKIEENQSDSELEMIGKGRKKVCKDHLREDKTKTQLLHLDCRIVEEKAVFFEEENGQRDFLRCLFMN